MNETYANQFQKKNNLHQKIILRFETDRQTLFFEFNNFLNILKTKLFKKV